MVSLLRRRRLAATALDVPARGSDVVTPRTDATIKLGSENNVLTGDVEILEGLTESLFAFAFRVDVGLLKDVDAGFYRSLDDLVENGVGKTTTDSRVLFPCVEQRQG